MNIAIPEDTDRKCPEHGTDMIASQNGFYCPYCSIPGWGD